MSAEAVKAAGISQDRLFSQLQGTSETSFRDLVKNYLSQVNDLQLKASGSIEDLALGKNVEIHQVMLAVEEADISLQLLLQIRNKLVESYQEVMRMQI